MKAVYRFIVTMVLGCFVLTSSVMAEDDASLPEMNAVQIIDYSSCEMKKTWFEKEWCRTVEFQKAGWKKGKEDLKALPGEIAKVPSNIANDVKNLFQSISTGVSKVMASATSVEVNHFNKL